MYLSMHSMFKWKGSTAVIKDADVVKRGRVGRTGTLEQDRDYNQIKLLGS